MVQDTAFAVRDGHPPALDRRNIFRAWDCVRVEYSRTERREDLRRSLSVQCEGAEHDRILGIALPLVVLWPVGSVLMYAALALRGRGRLLKHTHDKYVRAIRFLHVNFKPEYCGLRLRLRARSEHVASTPTPPPAAAHSPQQSQSAPAQRTPHSMPSLQYASHSIRLPTARVPLTRFLRAQTSGRA